MAKKRYVNTVTFYTYAEDEVEALEEGLDICNQINKIYDAKADVEQLHLQPFGSVKSLELDVTEIKNKINESKLK